MLGHRVTPSPSRPASSRAALTARALLAGTLVPAALVLAPLPPAALADPAPGEATPPAFAYQAEGREVEGGASLAQAALVDPGNHRDSFAAGGAEQGDDGTVKYYRVPVADGQRVHAAATIAAPPYADGLPEDNAQLTLDVSFLTAAGATCDDGWETDIGESQHGDGPITSTAVSDTMGPDGCAGDELFVRVAREGPRDLDVPLPVELQIAIQPAGIGGGAPAVEEPVEDDGARPIAPEDTELLTPGRSFAAPTVVEPGSHVLELVPGETAVLALDVKEGQRLRWRTEVVSQPENQPGSLSLRVHNAARSLVEVGGGSWPLGGSAGVRGGGMRAPVDLGNRSAQQTSIADAWLPGRHTVVLQRLQRDTAADPEGDAPVRLILTLEVEGETAEGAADGSVLELGDAESTSAGFFGGSAAMVRSLQLAGAAVLALVALVLGAAGVLVLRPRRS